MPSIYLKFAAGIKSFTTMKHKIELKRLPGTSFPETAHSSTKAGNKKSYSKFANLLSVVFAVAVFSFLSASCSQENAVPHFETSGEAVTAYREYLSDVQKTKSMEWEDLAVSIASWQELRDSVAAALQRDTVRKAHGYPEETFRAVHSAIAAEYQRLALTNPRTYRDVLYLKEQGTPEARREELQRQAEKMQPFFELLDTIPLYKDTPEKALKRYDRFLSATLENGIANKRLFLDYLRNEDVLFRSYLTHIPELAGTPMSGITDKTERCCLLAIQSAGKSDFPVEEAVQYLTLRTNRRLLQNTVACMKDIDNGKLKSPEQAQAYLWMMMQPLMGMDGERIALLTPEQKNTLYRLADNMAAATDRLCDVLGYDKKRMDGMPMLLLKIHLSTL